MKPRIIVTSADDADCFDWLSDGWNYEEIRDTTKAKNLFKRAKDAIEAGKDVPDTIRLLEEAGFEVVRSIFPAQS